VVVTASVLAAMTTTTEASSETRQRFKLTIAYDGRDFRGWQTQPGGLTVQDALLEALQSISPEIEELQGSGRTDAGVSALAQVAHFDAVPGWKMDRHAWLKALNTKLPRTIRVMQAEVADPDFHARFSAIGKEYVYTIQRGPVLSPLKLGRAWHVPQPLDLGLLNEALNSFLGTHDFTAFSANRGDGSDAGADRVRTLERADVKQSGDEMTITLLGNGFLYKMVRFLVGSSIKVAQEAWPLETLRRALAEPDQTGAEKAIFCAPADGLVLLRVRY
jgi:tRNA pseudouridine38-40 synthase